MFLKRFPALIAGLLLLPAPASANGPASLAADEAVLRAAHVGTDGASLLQYFRKHTINDVDADRIQDLIEQLGDDSFDDREKASAQLAGLGRLATPLLERAVKEWDVKDPEIAYRAARCLEAIQAGSGGTVSEAAARVLAARRPPGTEDVLLAYLPSAESDAVAEQVRHALAKLAVVGGRPNPVLVRGLSDHSPTRRAEAAVALCRARAEGALPAVRRLLQDPEPVVRFRVGLTLGERKERAAVPVLIDVLPDLSRGKAWEVVDFLCRIAGDSAPDAGVGLEPESRRRCRQAWEEWWKEHAASVDLARLDHPEPTLDYTMMVLLDPNKERGAMVELDKNSRTLWQIDGLQFPLDGQKLPGQRVLVAEQGADRVTERSTRTGEVLWECSVSSPLMAQRLPNGHTFINSGQKLTEVDREGTEVFSYPADGGDQIMRAVKLPNGDIAMVTNSRGYLRLSRRGERLVATANFPVQVKTSGGRIDVLPNGNVLIPEMATNRVVEYSPTGKEVWEAKVGQPIAVVRLPNGNTLATSMAEYHAVEIDPKGKTVWEYKSDTRITRAWRR